MIVEVPKYVRKCPECGSEVFADKLVEDYPCENCDWKVDFTEYHKVEIRNVEYSLTEEELRFNHSVVLDKLEVKIVFENDWLGFTAFEVKNPSIRPGFPQVDFPSQYQQDDVRDDVRTWILDNYSDVIKKLV